MGQPTVESRSAATTLFDLPEYEVLDVTRNAFDMRVVTIVSRVVEVGCAECGVLSSWVHRRTRQRLRDLPYGAPLEVWWLKRRFACRQEQCSRRSFTESTEKVPPRARMTRRLKDAVVHAAGCESRAVSKVVSQFQMAWSTAMPLISQAVARRDSEWATTPTPVTHLGIDEHRFRTVRWFKTDTDKWKRSEP